MAPHEKNRRNTEVAGDVDVPVADHIDDEILLNVYRAATALERAESKGRWRRVREGAARRIAGFRRLAAVSNDDRNASAACKEHIGFPSSDVSRLSSPRKFGFTEWVLPSKPLIVRVGETVSRTIQQRMVEARSRSPEVVPGGFLFGSITRSAVCEIKIRHDGTLCPWDSSRGGAPFLTATQTRTLRMPSAWPADLTPIGLYRTAHPIEKHLFAKSGEKRRREFMQAEAAVILNCARVTPAIGIALRIDAVTLELHASVLWSDGVFYDLLPAA